MAKMKKTTHETELKLQIGSIELGLLCQKLPHVGPLRRQINTFFDSSKLMFRAEHWALRLRLDGDQWFLTAKGPNSRQHGISDRIEIEEPCSVETAQLLNTTKVHLGELDCAPAKALLEKFGDVELSPWLSFINDRQVLLWEGCHLELDHSVCCQQHRYEIELELPMAELLPKRIALERWLNEQGIPFAEATDSKLAWTVAQTQKSNNKS
jgi:uncharacterized protein YjbK